MPAFYSSPARYSLVAIILHWLMAVLILAMIPMGLWMSKAVQDPEQQATAYRLFQVHKAIGLTILALTLFRLGWRAFHRPPPYPAHMRTWERFLARATQAAFYALMVLIPLTGWIYISTNWTVDFDEPLAVATSWFGLFNVPHLPVPEAIAARRDMAFQAMGTHETLAWLMVVLVALHIGAALKHQFVDHDGVLGHMVPGLRQGFGGIGGLREPSGSRLMPRVLGLLLVALVALGAWFTVRIPGGFVAPPEPERGAATSNPAASPGPATAMAPGTATAWIVSAPDSSIRFTGTSSGAPFEGRFETWSARIWFDPADLAGSRAEVIVQTGSARTGDATQTGTLAAPEWFDAATWPQARFVATEFVALADGRFEARGTLQIKDKPVPVVLPFTYSRRWDWAVVEGQIELDRTALGLGLVSDATGQWVSKTIPVRIRVVAEAVPQAAVQPTATPVPGDVAAKVQ